jgi:mannose-1-phosphate guanylyltransferase/mannose-6-phosphate isomerase
MRLGGTQSLLQRTILRSLPLATESRTIAIVTNQEYQFRTQEEFEELDAARGCRSTLLLEPQGRNTAPAIAVAALWALDQNEAATLLVLPADHLIPDEQEFQACALEAAQAAADGALVTFGIPPTGPETGFGYIESEPAPPGGSGVRVRAVRRFVEKPDAQRAAQFLAAGHFFWNSGMFCFRARAILDALEAHAPELAGQARLAWQSSRPTAAQTASAAVAQPTAGPTPRTTRVPLDATRFGACRDISIDYAVMERASNVLVLPARFGWSDIGSWKAVAEQFEADADGNTAQGEAMFVNTLNTHVQSEDRLVAAVGVDNLLVIDTPDALLVASKEASQQVKEIVSRLKAGGHEAARLHRTVARPWGTYTVLQEGPRFKIKRIEVRPGQSLSLQMHHHRSEHWIVVSGTAQVTCDDRTFLVSANTSTYIPIGSRHRLENPGVMQLVMIEVQCGDYLGEDDIVRFEDRYGRTP